MSRYGCFTFCDGTFYCDCESYNKEYDEKTLKILRTITLQRKNKVILKTNLHRLYPDFPIPS